MLVKSGAGGPGEYSQVFTPTLLLAAGSTSSWTASMTGVCTMQSNGPVARSHALKVRILLQTTGLSNNCGKIDSMFKVTHDVNTQQQS